MQAADQLVSFDHYLNLNDYDEERENMMKGHALAKTRTPVEIKLQSGFCQQSCCSFGSISSPQPFPLNNNNNNKNSGTLASKLKREQEKALADISYSASNFYY